MECRRHTCRLSVFASKKFDKKAVRGNIPWITVQPPRPSDLFLALVDVELIVLKVLLDLVRHHNTAYTGTDAR